MKNFPLKKVTLARLLVVLLVQIFAQAANGMEIPNHRPYCGIYCLGVACNIYDVKFDIKDFVKKKYIGSHKGSSINELLLAATDNGLYAQAVGRLNSTDLKSSPYHLILHTKSKPDKDNYDHYVLYLGSENGKAKIFDPPNPAKLIPFAQLAPNWDGNALIVSNEPISLNKIFWPNRLRLILYSIVAIAFILLIRLINKIFFKQIAKTITAKLGFSILQACAFGVIALLAGLGYHFADSEGFLANSNSTAAIEKAHIGNFIEKINKNQITQLLDNDELVIVDSRLKADYEIGHIDNARSIPTTLCDAGRAAVMKGITKDKQVVVYCQSAGCKYAETVATKLIDDGYENVSIYKAGWTDWNKQQP